MEPLEDQANDTTTLAMYDRIRALLSLPGAIDLDIFYSIIVDNYGAVILQGKADDVIKIRDLSTQFSDLEKKWVDQYPRIYFSHNGVSFEIVAA